MDGSFDLLVQPETSYRRSPILPHVDIDIGQVLLEARTRWLKPIEICDILRHFRKYEFQLNQEPPVKPPSGSLFLFDRKVVRYFRRDGHIWRKKKDGKTVREAHEKLKAGSIDILHCYYAHAEQDDRFQRRCYWLLDGENENIVLVHYREVSQGTSRAQQSPRLNLDYASSPLDASDSEIQSGGSPLGGSPLGGSPLHPKIGAVSPSSGRRPQMEALSPGYDSTSELDASENSCEPTGSRVGHSRNASMGQQEGDMERSSFLEEAKIPTAWLQDGQQASSAVMAATGAGLQPDGGVAAGGSAAFFPGQLSLSTWNSGELNKSMDLAEWAEQHAGPLDQNNSKPGTQLYSAQGTLVPEAKAEAPSVEELLDEGIAVGPVPDAVVLGVSPQAGESSVPDEDMRLRQLDSFDQWVQEVYGEPTETESGTAGEDSESFGLVQSSNRVPGLGVPLNAISEEVSDSKVALRAPAVLRAADVARLLSLQYTISDFAPPASPPNGGVKVLVVLGPGSASNQQHSNDGAISSPSFPLPSSSSTWSCLFGSCRVPARTVHPGVLHCIAPSLLAANPEAGAAASASELENGVFVSFAVADEEGRAVTQAEQFVYSTSSGSDFERMRGAENLEEQALVRSLVSFCSLLLVELMNRSGISNASLDTEWSKLAAACAIGQCTLSLRQVEQRLFEVSLHHYFALLLSAQPQVSTFSTSCATSSPSPLVNSFFEHGLQPLHLVSALGFAWAIPLLVSSGASVDSVDDRGRTPLHWAAKRGREEAVVALLAAGAPPSALSSDIVSSVTESETSSQATPADLASASGHAGIAAYLSEVALNRSLSTMSLRERKLDASTMQQAEAAGNAAATAAAAAVAPTVPLTMDNASSLNESLDALRSSAQAATLIHASHSLVAVKEEQVFEETAEKKKPDESDAAALNDEQIKGLVAARKVPRSFRRDRGTLDERAALRIQQRFRGWKGRREFLLTRRRVIKIQAHVKGHLQRKEYRRMRWAINILTFAVIRWRRRAARTRLLGQGGSSSSNTTGMPCTFPMDSGSIEGHAKLQEVTPEILEVAVGRVHEMVQSDEARAQYSRLRAAHQNLSNASG